MKIADGLDDASDLVGFDAEVGHAGQLVGLVVAQGEEAVLGEMLTGQLPGAFQLDWSQVDQFEQEVCPSLDARPLPAACPPQGDVRGKGVGLARPRPMAGHDICFERRQAERQ